MAQLTWKNIGIPGDRSSKSGGVPIASKMFDKTFDSLGNIVEDQRALEVKNFANQTEQNDLGIRANIQQLNDLAALNKEKPNLAIASLKKKYGVQFSPDEVDKMVTEQQTILRDKAYGVASQIGGQTADENFDVFTGGKAVEQSLLDQGMQPEVARTKANEWVQNSKMRQGEYLKAKSDNTQAALTELRSAASLPKSPEGITRAINALGDKYEQAGGFDRNTLTAELSQGLADRQKHTLFSQSQIDRQTRLDEKTNLNNTMAAGVAAFRQSANQDDYYSTIESSNLTAVQKSQARVQAKAEMDSIQSLSAPEMQIYNEAATAAQNQTTTFVETAQQNIGTIETEIANQTGITESIEDNVSNALSKNQGIVEMLSTDAQKMGWFEELFSLKIGGNDAPQFIEKTKNEMMQTYGSGVNKIPETEMNKLMLVAMHDSFGSGLGWKGGIGIDGKKYKEALNSRISKYHGTKKLRQNLTQAKNDLPEAQRALLTKLGSHLGEIKETLRQRKVTGKEADLKDFQKQIDIFTNKFNLNPEPVVQEDITEDAKQRFRDLITVN